MKRSLNYFLILFIIILTVYCGNKDSSSKKDQTEDQTAQTKSKSVASEESGQVEITQKQFETIQITLGNVEERNLSNLVKANGRIDVPPQGKANISSLVGGTIKNINVIEGDYVSKGEVLGSLSSTQAIQMQEEYGKAKDNFTFLEKEYQRQKKLYEQKVASGKKFQEAESNYKSQAASVKSLEDQLRILGISPSQISQGNRLSTIPIISPISGYVKLVKVNVGTFVEAAIEIFEIVNISHLHISLQVFENDFSKVNIGQKIYFTLPGQEDERIQGVIFKMGKVFDEKTKSVTVHAEIKDNKNQHLLPGMYVNGVIEVGIHKVPSLPVEAVVSEADKHYIYIFKGKKKEADGEVFLFKRMEVITGVSEESYIETKLLEQVHSNNTIVTHGAYYIESEMKKGNAGDLD